MSSNYVYLPEFDRRSEFDRGYEACWENYSDIVKKLGKKYYKEFLLETKNKDSKFYSSYTTTTHPHKCNCEFCELNLAD